MARAIQVATNQYVLPILSSPLRSKNLQLTAFKALQDLDKTKRKMQTLWREALGLEADKTVNHIAGPSVSYDRVIHVCIMLVTLFSI